MGVAANDVVGFSAVYTITTGQDALTDASVSAADRIEMGAHLAVGLAGGIAGGKGAIAAKSFVERGPILWSETGSAVAAKGTGFARPGEQLEFNFVSELSKPRIGQTTTVGIAQRANYRRTFFSAYPELEDKVVVHHAVEQQVLDIYPDLFTPSEIHGLANLRGIPNDINGPLHLSEIRRAWNLFYKTHPTATREDVIDFSRAIDEAYGSQFLPPRDK